MTKSSNPYQLVVCITSEIGKEGELLENLKKLGKSNARLNGGYVKEAYITYGVYDVVAEVFSESKDAYDHRFLNALRNIDGVRATISLTVVH